MTTQNSIGRMTDRPPTGSVAKVLPVLRRSVRANYRGVVAAVPPAVVDADGGSDIPSSRAEWDRSE